ncbi:MAG TPA: epoxyqueuosine reductase [Candidatus Latescibacteria bacterium]|nr:epoxyqueuosine reductase [Candidatus Latescibacterota bacterium]
MNPSPILKNYQWLRDFALKKGISLFGVARLDDLESVRSNLASLEWPSKPCYAVSLGVRLSHQVIEGIQDEPTLLYSWHYRQANIFLDRIAFEISLLIQDQGYRVLPVPASQIIDWERQVGHLSHKHVGVLSGHGWIGRNNLLVNPQFGARVRYVTVLTDIPLRTDRPVEGWCGDCRACIGACPAQALGELPADYDFQRCFQKLKEFRKRVGHYICGVCIKACKGGYALTNCRR